MKAKGHVVAAGRVFVAAAAAIVSFSGCGGPQAPANPTWADDIRPLMVARCIRCHDAEKRQDPLPGGVLISNFNRDSASDLGLANLKALGVTLVRQPFLAFRRMPPPPAEALEDWQIEMLETWAKNPQ